MNMTPEARTRVLGQLTQVLAPGGYLVLGADESADELPNGLTSQGSGLLRLDPAARVAA